MLDLNEHVNHLRALLQCRFWCSRSRVGPEILPLYLCSRKWLWWWSWDYTLRSFKTMVHSFLVLLEITNFNPAKHWLEPVAHIFFWWNNSHANRGKSVPPFPTAGGRLQGPLSKCVLPFCCAAELRWLRPLDSGRSGFQSLLHYLLT